MRRLLKTWVVHQVWPGQLKQPCVLPWHHYLPLVERHVKLVLVMALPIALARHTCHILQASIIRPSVSLPGIIHKVHDPVHLPLALVPDQGVHQEPVLQAHHDQHPVLYLMPDPKHLQKVADLMGQVILTALSDIVLLQGYDEDTTAGGKEDAGHSDDEETLSHGTVSLFNISASNNEDACKAIMHEAVRKSDIQYGNW